MKTSSDTEFAAFVGIDWADRKHDVCVQAAGSSKRSSSTSPRCWTGSRIRIPWCSATS